MVSFPFHRRIVSIYDPRAEFRSQMDETQNNLPVCAATQAESRCLERVFSSLCLVLQASLNKLMETLGQSEPYFVKCIRSNAEKVQ